MKTKIRNVVSILTLGLLILACNKGSDDLSIQYKDEATSPKDEVVAMGSISLNTIFKDVIEVTTGKAPALEDLLDEMNVEIKRQEFSGWTYILNTNYRDLSATIPLLPGTYSLLISNSMGTAPRFDIPVYGAHTEFGFGVTAGANTTLDLELELLDLAATINFSNELTLTYPDIEARVDYTSANNVLVEYSLNWTTTDTGRTGYLNTYAGDFVVDDYFYPTTGTLFLEITATDDLGQTLVFNKVYQNATANQHYNITIEQTAAASVSLNITLGDEDIINDTVTFPN